MARDGGEEAPGRTFPLLAPPAGPSFHGKGGLCSAPALSPALSPALLPALSPALVWPLIRSLIWPLIWPLICSLILRSLILRSLIRSLHLPSASSICHLPSRWPIRGRLHKAAPAGSLALSRDRSPRHCLGARRLRFIPPPPASGCWPSGHLFWRWWWWWCGCACGCVGMAGGLVGRPVSGPLPP